MKHLCSLVLFGCGVLAVGASAQSWQQGPYYRNDPYYRGGYSQQGYGYGYSGPPVKNNMAIAIVSTVVGFLCGCLGVIPGIIAIVMAGQVNGKLAHGDVAGAQQSAKNARTLAIIAFVIAAALVALGIVRAFVVGSRTRY